MPACLVARQAATNARERAARTQTQLLDGAKRASAETAKRICSATCACTSTTVGARDQLERKLSRRLQLPRGPPQHGQPVQDLARNCFDEARRRQCTQCDWQLHSLAPTCNRVQLPMTVRALAIALDCTWG